MTYHLPPIRILGTKLSTEMLLYLTPSSSQKRSIPIIKALVLLGSNKLGKDNLLISRMVLLTVTISLKKQ